MEVYSTEDQQVEFIKKALKQYAPLVIGAVVLGLVANFSWQGYSKHQKNVSAKASFVYERVIDSLAADKYSDVSAQANDLFENYSSTPYASLTSFMLARQSVYQSKIDKAEGHLNWVIEHSQSRSLRQIARLRLARLLLGNKKLDKALATLEKVEEKVFLTAVNEVRGDIYLAKGEKSQARTAYGDALKGLPKLEQTRPLLQMKYDALANFDVERQAFVSITK